jgi:integrase
MTKPKARRTYGTGSLFVHRGKWYGQWRGDDDRQIKRKIGAIRPKGTAEGLTRPEASARLTEMMREVRLAAPPERFTIEAVGERYVDWVRQYKEGKPSTLQDYEGILRQAVEHFGTRSVARISVAEVEAYRDAKLKLGRAPKTVTNHLNFLNGLFTFAVKRKWASANPVAGVDRPRPAKETTELRYLDAPAVERLIAAVPSDSRGPTDRALYMTATMCGLRQGELIALRWRDVDTEAGVIRVRRSFTRGKMGTPKSKLSNRAVPMPSRVEAELAAHRKRSAYATDDALVFCHPETGKPYDPSKMRKRYADALKAAKVRRVRFHDLRHTYGTRMVSAGTPMRALQSLMGHSNIETTEIYADWEPDPNREAAWAAAAFPDQ